MMGEVLGAPSEEIYAPAVSADRLTLWGLYDEGSLSLAGVFSIMLHTLRPLPDHFISDHVPQHLEEIMYCKT